MRFFKDVAGTFLTEVIIVVCNMLIGILTARTLGPEMRGVFTLVMTLPLTLVALSDPGISQATVYFIGRKKKPPALVASNSALLALIMGTVVAAVVFLARDLLLTTVLQDLPGRYFMLVLCLLPALLLYTFWIAILRALQRFTLFNLLRLLVPVLLLTFLSIVLVIFQQGIGWATVAYGLGLMSAALISLVVVGYLLRPRAQISWSLLKQSLLYGLKSYAQTLVGHLTYRLDIYLVAFFLPPAEIAFYGIATSIAELVWYIPNSVGMVLFPKLSSTAERDIHVITAEVCRHTFAVTAAVGLAVLVAGTIGIPILYGTAYRPATRPLLLLIPGTTVMTLYKVLTRNFSSRDRQEISILAAFSGLLLNGTLDWLLIPRLGIQGAALASTLAYSFAGLLLVWAFLRESGLGWQSLIRLRAEDIERYRELIVRLRIYIRKVTKKGEKHVEEMA
jgi:O-antigen/teichoic acid export membrane protein